MQNYRELRCWILSHDICLQIYKTTSNFPTEEKYGLTSQIRRSALSVGSNIAEGSGRSTKTDFARFIDIATGSAAEMDYQLLVARDLKYIDEPKHGHLQREIERLKISLHRFNQSLRSN